MGLHRLQALEGIANICVGVAVVVICGEEAVSIAAVGIGVEAAEAGVDRDILVSIRIGRCLAPFQLHSVAADLQEDRVGIVEADSLEVAPAQSWY